MYLLSRPATDTRSLHFYYRESPTFTRISKIVRTNVINNYIINIPNTNLNCLFVCNLNICNLNIIIRLVQSGKKCNDDLYRTTQVTTPVTN